MLPLCHVPFPLCSILNTVLAGRYPEYVAYCLTFATTFSAFGSWSAKKGIATMGFPWNRACSGCMSSYGVHTQLL